MSVLRLSVQSILYVNTVVLPWSLIVCFFLLDSTLDGLAVDYLNRLLFLTDAGLNQITAISLFQPKYSKVIISQNLDKPRAIVAHPWKG